MGVDDRGGVSALTLEIATVLAAGAVDLGARFFLKLWSDKNKTRRALAEYNAVRNILCVMQKRYACTRRT